MTSETEARNDYSQQESTFVVKNSATDTNSSTWITWIFSLCILGIITASAGQYVPQPAKKYFSTPS